jgi:adenylate cyclase
VTTSRRLPLLSAGAARIALQRSLETELAPSRQLEWSLQIIIPACLAAAALLALGMARGVSRPVQMLAAFTEHVVRGDFSRRIELTRSDELGDLASAFNRMSAGLADRDRVRDLLGKVVSPEIAAQLLQSEAVLGGEEREVTILFSDLRNFTGLSERLPPREVLALLNRYLDRMSSIVEEHHGVVDKFIGDAIMALFGTPVADPDAADHALAAAQAMEKALLALNTELAAEGRPQLAIGIGINTARVVAGNMGSQRRLNYTVIGDGVNVAARLEALTKDAAYGTRILISESTRKAARAVHPMRAVGGVVIHGRKETVMAFAVDSAV